MRSVGHKLDDTRSRGACHRAALYADPLARSTLPFQGRDKASARGVALRVKRLSLQLARRGLMAAHQIGQVEAGNGAGLDRPAPVDHDAVGAMGAA